MSTSPVSKGAAVPMNVPMKRTQKQQAADARRVARNKAERELADAQTAQKAQAAQLAQIVNLHIAGFSLGDIGASVGKTADEIDRMLREDTARYVRTQPALRTYVRNYISGKYDKLLEAVWDEATDRGHPKKLENQDRAVRILERMAKLHGADAPTQAEVKIETQPEAVEAMVKALAASQGMAYDDSVFDVVDAEIIHDGVEALVDPGVSGNGMDDTDEGEL